jgi:predicted ATPase
MVCRWRSSWPRVRALSLAEILDGLHDRFRLLTGGARAAVRRQ